LTSPFIEPGNWDHRFPTPAHLPYHYSRSVSERGALTREIDLATAVSEIGQACDDDRGKSPFFIIAGAGTSYPSVPLASKIAEDCQTTAAKYNRTGPPAGASPLDIYSHWLQMAFPQASQRQRYFKGLISDKPISHANFRLAHLLLEKRLATLVVTPNFDDFLSRALDLFGQPHIICDHPYTVERIDPESPEIQIVHVHGTYWFYDCCNLRGEIEARTKDSRDRAETMTSLLDKIMSRHSPIVVGYSGWEGDVIMTALKRRLTSGLPNNLYWFCYERAGLEPLRAFFRNHADVCLVLPPDAPARESTATTDELPAMAEKLLPGTASQPTLSAQLVLDTFVNNFTAEAPKIFLDPIGFFLDQLRDSFPRDSVERQSDDVYKESQSDDIYKMSSLIRDVEHVRSTAKGLTKIDDAIKKVIDAVRRSAYPEAIALAQPLASLPLSDEQRETLIDITYSASVGLMDNSKSELDGYSLVVALAIGDVLTRPRVPWYLAAALFNKGVTLGQLNRNAEEIQAYDEALRRIGDATEPALREQISKALFNKGVTLGHLSRSEEAIQAYDELLRRFGDATEPALREPVAKALFNKGITLGRLSRSEEENPSLRRGAAALRRRYRARATRASCQGPPQQRRHTRPAQSQ
jgi:tetratricopeptide (TPR) repeat protein